MKTQLVSFLYFNDLPELNLHITVARLDRYLHSLTTLNKIGHPIKFFCNASIAEKVENHIQKNNLDNVSLEVRELTEFKHTNKILEIKKKFPEEFKFYLEIGWAKIELLKEVYESDPDLDYLYWIDCGLAHRGIFPDSFLENPGEASGKSANYENYNFIHIFNKEVFSKLNYWAGDKLVDIRNTLFFHNHTVFKPILNVGHTFNSLTVGGIIGGKANNIPLLAERFEHYADICISKEHIVNHEAILSCISGDLPHLFRSWEFNTWYHRDSIFYGAPLDFTDKVSFYQFFEQL